MGLEARLWKGLSEHVQHTHTADVSPALEGASIILLKAITLHFLLTEDHHTGNCFPPVFFSSLFGICLAQRQPRTWRCRVAQLTALTFSR
jgi:hypothetical protein